MPEILVIGFLLIVFFGKDKLPDLASSVGKSFNLFKKEIAGKVDGVDEITTSVNEAKEELKKAETEVKEAITK